MSSIKKSFIDNVSSLVNESIDGLVVSSGGHLKKVNADEDSIRVVVRSDYEESVKNASKVSLISGGGSGHEPLHAGFVGSGMLTAAVCGDIFASPPVDAVLTAIKTVTGTAGCLLIIKNYTGDRLNFGLAAEKARSIHGLNVKAIMVSDDISLPDCAQPRGIAGTVLVEKFAGYLAEKGASLEDIYTQTLEFTKSIYSIGVSLSTCNIPGVPKDIRLDGDEYELGLGIHGEPGCQKNSMESASQILEKMVSVLTQSKSMSNPSGKQYFLLLNNLGTVTPMEMTFIAGKAIEILKQSNIEVSHISSGSLVTSLDMNGFSLTLVELSPEKLDALTSPVGPSAWVAAQQVMDLEEVTISIPKEEEPEPLVGPLLNQQAKQAIEKAMRSLCEYEGQLTKWDQVVGDGDCGQTLRKGAEAVLGDLESYPEDPALLCKAIACSISKSMGGSSGVILRLFFTAAEIAVRECGPETGLFSAGLVAGTESVMEYGGAKVGSRTMVDALHPAMMQAQNGGNLTEIAAAAKEGAASTGRMAAATHGRSQYLTGSDLSGVPDPGAMAVALVLEEVASSLVMDSS